MVQGPVQRSEERAAVAPILGVGDARRRLVEPLVDPAVVRGKHLEERFHPIPPEVRRTLSQSLMSREAMIPVDGYVECARLYPRTPACVTPMTGAQNERK